METSEGKKKTPCLILLMGRPFDVAINPYQMSDNLRALVHCCEKELAKQAGSPVGKRCVSELPIAQSIYIISSELDLSCLALPNKQSGGLSDLSPGTNGDEISTTASL